MTLDVVVFGLFNIILAGVFGIPNPMGQKVSERRCALSFCRSRCCCCCCCYDCYGFCFCSCFLLLRCLFRRLFSLRSNCVVLVIVVVVVVVSGMKKVTIRLRSNDRKKSTTDEREFEWVERSCTTVCISKEQCGLLVLWQVNCSFPTTTELDVMIIQIHFAVSAHCSLYLDT